MEHRSLYRAIRADARNWWYHAQLRKEGAHREARKLEHDSTRRDVRAIRATLANGGYLNIGRGGPTLHIGKGRRIEGCHRGFAEACLLAGVPTIDTRTIPEDRIVETVSLPMIGVTDVDPAPWGSLSKAPLAVMANVLMGMGATLHNIGPDDLEPFTSDDFRQVSILEQAEEMGGFFGAEMARQFFGG